MYTSSTLKSLELTRELILKLILKMKFKNILCQLDGENL